MAKSNIIAFGKLGVKVLLTGPPELMPEKESIPSHCEIVDLDQAITRSEVVMFLRIQHERHLAFELNTDNYNSQYGLNTDRVKQLKPHAIIMHPGPVNRDIEILSDLVEHPQSRIFKQTENGVYTRMAILDWIYS